MFGNSWSNSYISYVLLIITLHFTCVNRKNCQTSNCFKILCPGLYMYISVRAGGATLLSWREWWEDITELGWLTLCSPPQAKYRCILEDCPYWGGGSELFKDINNCAILASCWQSFSASPVRNSSNLRSLSAFSFN